MNVEFSVAAGGEAKRLANGYVRLMTTMRDALFYQLWGQKDFCAEAGGIGIAMRPNGLCFACVR
jgi:hypothetical protein